MSKTKYSAEHEYVSLDGAITTIGISNYAQEQLGDIVYVELPTVGASFAKGDEIAVVESVKAASELYSPVGGTVVEVNDALEADPSLVNSDAEGNGWIFKLTLSNDSELDDLMDETAYSSHIA